MSFHPRTPQSPSQVSPPASSEATVGIVGSMSTATTLPTPAHSVSGSGSQLDIAMNGDSPNKRKRAIDDDGDRDQKKVHVQLEGQHNLGVEDLHLDVGEKYLLRQIRKTPYAALFPLPSRNRILTVVRTFLKEIYLLTW